MVEDYTNKWIIWTHEDFSAVTNNACTTTGSPQQITTTILSIVVIDGNDNAPVFEGASYTAVLPEGTFDTRREILTVNATDPDSGTNAEITYSIAGGTSGDFQIDPQTVSCTKLNITTQLMHMLQQAFV